MPSDYGINVTVGSDATRPIEIQSTTPIAIVGTTSGSGKVKQYASPDKAYTAFSSDRGTIKQALSDLKSQHINSPVIVSVTPALRSGQEAKIIESVEALKTAEATTGYRPNLIIAPEFSNASGVNAKMKEVAEFVRGTAIIDLNVASESAAITTAGSFGSRRVLLVDPYVTITAIDGSQVHRPASTFIAGLIAKTDGTREYGWADSFSNRIINGVIGTKRAIDFVAGQDCQADRIRKKKITTIIRYKGFRSWGGETTDADPIWSDLTRVRVFDRISEAALDKLFWAIDRRATDVLTQVKVSVEGMCHALQGAGVLLGFKVKWDSDKNTNANITAGKFYLKCSLQNSPIVKRIEVAFNYSDKFGQVLFKEVQ